MSDLYSDIIPFNVESIINNDNSKLDPNYIAGFTGADGSFTITKLSPTGKWSNYHSYFKIHQNVREIYCFYRK